MIKHSLVFVFVTGVCNPLDTPHHAKATDTPPYREGVVLNKPAREGRSLVDVGLQKEVEADQAIQAGMRVTLKMLDKPG